MNTDRFSKTLAASVQMLLAKQGQTVQICMSYSAWAESLGYNDKANFLIRHAQDKRKHIMKILSYLRERGEKEKEVDFPVPHVTPESMISCFEKVSDLEADLTKTVHKLIKLSFTKDDLTTWTFMQRLVDEQAVEEMVVKDLLIKLKIASGVKVSSQSLYTIGRNQQKTGKGLRSR